jgi:hypothetical protein
VRGRRRKMRKKEELIHEINKKTEGEKRKRVVKREI